MKYFLVAGEASGDLHASNLMKELLRQDPEARFRFFGGDRMAEVGGEPLRHYRDMAFMGITAVLWNARALLNLLDRCKAEIAAWQPDALILVDYAGFNLRIAAHVKRHQPGLKVHFYISPKLWVWQEGRIKAFRQYIDHLYVILPFEPAYFAGLGYPAEYVGNPSVDSVDEFLTEPFDEAEFRRRNGLDERPILALLPGSRQGEVTGNLPLMVAKALDCPAFQPVVAIAPGQPAQRYAPFLRPGIRTVTGETYALLRSAHTAVVTSGTATLETALFGVPQVVTFAVKGGPLPNAFFKVFMHVRWFSLVNLVAGRTVVTELMGKNLNRKNLDAALDPLLVDGPARQDMLSAYADVRRLLGGPGAARRCAAALLGHHRTPTA